MTIAARLAELGIELPKAAAPVASYQAVVVSGNMAYLSGQLPFVDGALVTGKLGADVTLEQGNAAARACGLMILAQLEAAGLLERVERIVKLGGFVASTADFSDQPKVVNGASDLIAEHSPWFSTAAGTRHRRRAVPPRAHLRYWVAEDAGRIVGWGEAEFDWATDVEDVAGLTRIDILSLVFRDHGTWPDDE